MNHVTTSTRSRTLNRLSAARVDNAAPGIHQDGGGLILCVDAKGGRKWVFRFTSPVTGKRRDMGLGRAGKGFVPLADARQAAADARALIGRGLDPMVEAERDRQAKAADAARAAPRTFGQFADEWLDQNEGQFASGKHVKELRVTRTLGPEAGVSSTHAKDGSRRSTVSGAHSGIGLRTLRVFQQARSEPRSHTRRRTA